MNIIKWFQMSRAIGRNDHSRVLSLCQAALKKNPHDFAALSFAATHSFRLDDLESARNYADRGLSLRPEDFDLRCLIIQILQKLNDHQGILEQARWLLAIEETNSDEINPEAIKTVQNLERLVPKGANIPSASKVLRDNQQLRDEYIVWAREYVNHNGPSA
jgi:tetratricopeptide (TPR) repeat protein